MMFGSAILDTAIGMAFMFFLLATLCSALIEWLSNLLKKRAKYLLRGLRDLLATDPPAVADKANKPIVRESRKLRDAEVSLYNAALSGTAPAQPVTDKDLVVAVMNHPLTRPYKQSRSDGKDTRNPSYLPSKAFALALIDVLDPVKGERTDDSARIAAIRAFAVAQNDSPLGKAIHDLLNAAKNDLKEFLKLLEQWYDSSMEAVGNAYKKWCKRWLIVITLVIGAIFHVDAIAIARTLYTNEPVRQVAVAAATDEKNRCTLPATDTTTSETADATTAAAESTAAAAFSTTQAIATPVLALAAAAEAEVAETTGSSASTPVDPGQCVVDQLEEFGAAGIPVGWGQWSPWPPASQLPLLILGLLITALAGSLGAPFWFDVLNRLGTFRNAGKKPDKGS